MAKKLSFDEEMKAIEAEEQKLAERRSRLRELEHSERTDLMTKSLLAKTPLAELKSFLDLVKKMGFAEAHKRLKNAN